MSKPELGTKRVCPVTGRKFYDLNKDPIISPYTGQVVPVSAAPRSRADVLAAAKPVAREEEAELPEVADADLVPLEEADAETTGTGAVAKVDTGEEEEDVELAEDLEDDSSFLEESEDEDDDVTDIIGGDIEDEEET